MCTLCVTSAEHESQEALIPLSTVGAFGAGSGPPVSRAFGLRFVTVIANWAREKRLGSESRAGRQDALSGERKGEANAVELT